MSKKFKRLRKMQGKTIEKLAEATGVEYRTVINWEKPEGVVPRFEMMVRIAEVLGKRTIDVYECFMKDPDEVDEEQKFKFHDHSDFQPGRNHPSPFGFFRFISSLKLWNQEGFLAFKDTCFRFRNCFFSSLDADEEGAEWSIDQWIYMTPFIFRDQIVNGCLLEDGNLNIVVLQVEDIQEWRCCSSTNNSVVIDLFLKKGIFPGMNEQENKVTMTLFLDLREKPYDKFHIGENVQYVRMEPRDIMAAFIKQIREDNNMNQQEFAEKLSYYSEMIAGKQITKGTVSKWEASTMFPTPLQLRTLEIAFKAPIDRILDAFDHGIFNSTLLNHSDWSYCLGMNYQFEKSTDFDGLKAYMESYVFAKGIIMVNYKKEEVSWGNVIDKDGASWPIRWIFVEENGIIIHLPDTRLVITKETLQSIDYKKSFYNFQYDFAVSLADETASTEIKISLFLFA